MGNRLAQCDRIDKIRAHLQATRSKCLLGTVFVVHAQGIKRNEWIHAAWPGCCGHTNLQCTCNIANFAH